MPYPAIDPLKLRVLLLSQRHNLLNLDDEMDRAMRAVPPADPAVQEKIEHLAKTMLAARERQALMLTYGAHLIKNGAGPLLNRLIETGLATHLATQGAGIIHDWEFAFQGHSGESVRENAPAGIFGAWEETGRYLNLAVLAGAADGLGFGESIGRMIEEDRIVLPSPDQLRQCVSANPEHPLAAAKADLLRTMKTFGLHEGKLTIPHPFKYCSVPACAYRHRIPPRKRHWRMWSMGQVRNFVAFSMILPHTRRRQALRVSVVSAIPISPHGATCPRIGTDNIHQLRRRLRNR